MGFSLFGNKKKSEPEQPTQSVTQNEATPENAPEEDRERLVRPMERGDIDAVIAIIEGHDEDDAEEAQEDFEDSIEGMFVATDNGRIVGVTGAFADEEASDVYWLSWTYVATDQQRKGIGRYLVGGLFDHLQNQGARKIFITTGEYVEDGVDIYAAARAFYQSMGATQELKMEQYFSDDEARYIFGINMVDQPDALPENVEQAGHIIFDGLYPSAEIEDGLTLTWREFDPEEELNENPKEKLESLISEARSNKMRFVMAALPSDLSGGASQGLKAMGFKQVGALPNFYEPGVAQDHWVLPL